VDIPSSITGDVLDGDLNTAVVVQPSPGAPTYTATFEDWYEVILGIGKTLTVGLDFPGTGADLDMYLFEPDGNSLIILASGTSDNIDSGTYSEEMSQYLSAGTYFVAVDAYSTPSGRAGYTLDISTGDSSVNICDWFSFSLTSQALVTIVVTGGPSFVLTDDAGTSTLASGGAAGTSITLAEGTYLIGLTEGGTYTLSVTSQ
jgi:hypothetical protein